MFSIFDIFKIGIGPSSSHTTGPMRIAKRVLLDAEALGILAKCDNIIVELQGSLALTGIGHATDKASIWGLMGYEPESIDTIAAENDLAALKADKKIRLLGKYEIAFDAAKNIDLRGDIIPELHPNGMAIKLYEGGNLCFEQVFYSTGGGFIASHEQLSRPLANDIVKRRKKTPFEFTSATGLLQLCRENSLNIHELALKNEDSLRPRAKTEKMLREIWAAMNLSIERGLKADGILPGGLNVKRRAAALYNSLQAPAQELERLFDWLNVYAMAVNEENAIGGKIVTAPTNGASGLIPALIKYYCANDGFSDADCLPEGKIGKFLLVAGTIGIIYKQRASLSGAEMGCQGEVGVACSMGAAGLCAVWGGNAIQIEHAGEIAMEHNLGLTCDPVGGLVQIPCIERNAIGAVKAANSARLALMSAGEHKVTLDQVIETMRQTGIDMSSKYKETSLGGLAVNVVEC